MFEYIASPFPHYTSSCSGHTVFLFCFLDLSSEARPSQWCRSLFSFMLLWFVLLCFFSIFFSIRMLRFFYFAKQRTDEKNRHGDDGGRVTTIDARRWHTGGFCPMKQVYKQPSVCVLYILFIFIFDWFSLPGSCGASAHFCYNSVSLVCEARFRCPVIWFLCARYYSNRMRTKWNIKIDSSRV